MKRRQVKDWTQKQLIHFSNDLANGYNGVGFVEPDKQGESDTWTIAALLNMSRAKGQTYFPWL